MTETSTHTGRRYRCYRTDAQLRVEAENWLRGYAVQQRETAALAQLRACIESKTVCYSNSQLRAISVGLHNVLEGRA